MGSNQYINVVMAPSSIYKQLGILVWDFLNLKCFCLPAIKAYS